jgi:PKHD-type hydroxylase
VFISIKNIIAKDSALELANKVKMLNWQNGAESAGIIAGKVKNNWQLLPKDPLVKALSDKILDILQESQEFFSFALPKKIFPPSFNLYQKGQFYGSHIDNAVRVIQNHLGESGYVRCDLSATLFLSDANSYDGGELAIEDNIGTSEIKLDAGDLFIYPANTVHQVKPIVAGERIASFFWIESLVANNEDRQMLFKLDNAIRSLQQEGIKNQQIIDNLLAVYHNLLRKSTNT